MDEIFFRTAEQLPGKISAARSFANWRFTPATRGQTGMPRTATPRFLRGSLPRTRFDPQMLLLDLKKQIANRVFKERKLAKDFRVAMTHLCLAELAGGSDGH